jgi:hypothetical protein
VQIPIGSVSATVTVTDAEAEAAGFYVLAVTSATRLPVGKPESIYEAFVDMIEELVDAFGQYKDCLVAKNWIGQLGCRPSSPARQAERS